MFFQRGIIHGCRIRILLLLVYLPSHKNPRKPVFASTDMLQLR
jgi:hypothetical protein